MSTVSYKESELAFIWLRLSKPPAQISPPFQHIRAGFVPSSQPTSQKSAKVPNNSSEEAAKLKKNN